MIIKGGGGIKLTAHEAKAIETMLSHAETDLSYGEEGTYHDRITDKERADGQEGLRVVREIISVLSTF